MDNEVGLWIVSGPERHAVMSALFLPDVGDSRANGAMNGGPPKGGRRLSAAELGDLAELGIELPAEDTAESPRPETERLRGDVGSVERLRLMEQRLVLMEERLQSEEQRQQQAPPPAPRLPPQPPPLLGKSGLASSGPVSIEQMVKRLHAEQTAMVQGVVAWRGTG